MKPKPKKNSHYNKELKPLARELRNDSTPGEIILWKDVLRSRNMHGFQFLRQYSIDNYIVDFVCRKLMLIIEIDGYSHNFKYEEDKVRDAHLNKLGYEVLRFEEKEVKYDIDNVVRVIEDTVLNLEARDHQSPSPPSPRGI